jgi:predicted ATP-grasp superfamily ATP-dependent carboligase
MTQTLEPQVRTQAAATQPDGTLPPAIILGGEANALSVARRLGRLGVKVFAINFPSACIRGSRYCHWIDVPADGDAETSWANFLLGPDAAYLHGAVLLACSDDGITVLARHREELAQRFRLDLSYVTAQLAMLDKCTTYKIAKDAGVPTPRFWIVEGREQVMAVRDELVFPLIVKPRLSHLFEQQFGKKYFTANNFDELTSAFDKAASAGHAALLVEYIPGGDDKLCSYYTYLDEAGTAQFDFTKRIIRRYPTGMGAACSHITDWIPELVPLGRALFAGAKLRGLANVEFKLDDRDGQYKLIECNARFTASNCLVAAAGVDLAAYVYNRIIGRALPPMKQCHRSLRLWDPIRDFWAFRELHKTGKITIFAWLASILHRQTFAYMAWTDPRPFVDRVTKPLRRRT